MSAKTLWRRFRVDDRGIAQVEAVFSSLLLSLIIMMALFAHNVMLSKNQLNTEIRTMAWNYALNGQCEAEESTLTGIFLNSLPFSFDFFGAGQCLYSDFEESGLQQSATFWAGATTAANKHFSGLTEQVAEADHIPLTAEAADTSSMKNFGRNSGMIQLDLEYVVTRAEYWNHFNEHLMAGYDPVIYGRLPDCPASLVPNVFPAAEERTCKSTSLYMRLSDVLEWVLELRDWIDDLLWW